ncbi:MAG: hypothetical protein IJJ71_05090, partial [Treponema sp.]|uniref:hypothetical protein n=1 Tax=Treponema sp. TaxID=166 RepID=UPI0025D14BEB
SLSRVEPAAYLLLPSEQDTAFTLFIKAYHLAKNSPREFFRLRRRSLPRSKHSFERDSLKTHLVSFSGYAVAHYRLRSTAARRFAQNSPREF